MLIIHRWENWGLEKLSDLLRVTQLELGFKSKSFCWKARSFFKFYPTPPTPIQYFSKCGLPATALPGMPGQMKLPGPHPRLSESESLGEATKYLIYFLCTIKSENLGFLGLYLLKLVLGPCISGTFLQIRIISNSC